MMYAYTECRRAIAESVLFSTKIHKCDFLISFFYMSEENHISIFPVENRRIKKNQCALIYLVKM